MAQVREAASEPHLEPTALYHLGFHTLHGQEGLEKNFEEARRLLLLAARLNEANAQSTYAEEFLEKNSDPEYFKWVGKSMRFFLFQKISMFFFVTLF